MFIFLGLILGVLLTVMLGGSLRRVTDVRFRRSWLVFAAVAVQLGLFSPLGTPVPPLLFEVVYLGTHALLVAFALSNLRLLSLLPISIGMAMNTIAIAANGGRMPMSDEAAAAAGITADETANVSARADRLTFLGDVFALPSGMPFANVFSVGDLLIVVGAAAFVAAASFGPSSEAAVRMSAFAEPLREPTYRRLVVGSLVSRVGDWLTLAALIGWIYGETGSTTHVAGLLLARLAPPILGGGLAAMLVDRLPKTELLTAVELLRALTVGGALYGILGGHLAVVFAALAVSGLLAAVSSALVPAIVPSLLPRERLAAANAGIGVAQDVALAVGALLAGVVLSTTDVIVALNVDVVTFGVAAFLYAGIAIRLPAAATRRPPRGESGFAAGVRYVVRQPRILAVIGAFGVATIATGLANATLPSFLGDLGLGTSAYGFGLAALGVGLILGQAMIGVVRIGETGVRWMPCALALMGAVFIALAHTEHALTALLLLVLIGFVDGTTDVLFDTIIQREADERYLGRVFALGSVFFTTTMTGALAAAPLADAIAAPSEIFVAAGVFVVAASGVAALGFARRGAAAGRTRESAFDPFALRYLELAGIDLAAEGLAERRPLEPEGAEIIELAERLRGVDDFPEFPRVAAGGATHRG
jgi:MFS family permease